MTVRLKTFAENVAADKPLVTLLTCYMTGSTEGRNLGAPGYSHDFVARLYAPILEQLGEVIAIADPEDQLEPAVKKVLAEGKQPVHFSILPLQDVTLTKNAPNIVVPAWEFPDVPDHEFDHNPQNNWPAVANACDLVLVSGPFTVNSLRKGGTTAPMRIVPVPTPDEYFDVASWQPNQTKTVHCRAFVFPQGDSDSPERSDLSQPRKGVLSRLGKLIERTVRRGVRSILSREACNSFSRSIQEWKTKRLKRAAKGRAPRPISLPYESVPQLDLSGVVYTSIFNPDDGRKNWTDLMTGCLLALADREDATLVVKLISRKAASVQQVIDYYRGRDIQHKCKLVFICDFLSDEQMRELTEATTYYVQTTKAEGNCLPLMNYLAAGRPGVSPDHSSMGDYFTADSGFVIESHQEPAAWPHDPKLRLRSTWGRIVWTSLYDQVQASYRLATEDAGAYQRLSERCRRKMKAWAGIPAVTARLRGALDELLAGKLANRPDDAETRQATSRGKAA